MYIIGTYVPPVSSVLSISCIFVAHLLLHHLEAPWAQLPGDHLLPAVALAGAFGGLGHGLVVGHLDEVTYVELLQAYLWTI